MHGRSHLAAAALLGGWLAAGTLGGAAATTGRDDGAPDTAAPDATAPDAAALVNAMSRALQTLNYEGTFVHLQGAHASSMRILHTSDAEGELERMTSLDGEAREVIRDHSRVTCIWPGSRSVVVSKSKPRKLLPDIDATLADNPSYAFAVVGTDRVAGLPTDVVEIRPHDRYRYGYRFWIDSDTRMLLRSMLLDGAAVVEQVLFTTISYPESLPRSRFAVDVEREQVSWIEPPRERSGGRPTDAAAVARAYGDAAAARAGGAAPPSVANGAEIEDGVDRVRFEGLPAGYVELSETYRAMSPVAGALSHVMLSDGMASVSVYVEHAAATDQDTSAVGLSSMGAVNAYGTSLPDGFVTVVGEVPPGTVREIAAAVRLVE